MHYCCTRTSPLVAGHTTKWVPKIEFKKRSKNKNNAAFSMTLFNALQLYSTSSGPIRGREKENDRNRVTEVL